MKNKLSSKERLIRQARGQEIDHVPLLGGWMNGIRNISQIAGISTEEYMADPMAGVVRANLALGVDGMVSPVIPKSLDEIRSGEVTLDCEHQNEPEALLKKADSLPCSESEALKSFNASVEEKRYRDYFESAFSGWHGIEPIPTFWELGGHFSLYQEYGYEAFLVACALYPEAIEKIWWYKSLLSREMAKILIKLYKEYNLVPLLFCGEDMCYNKGPMVSPDFLRKHYFPTVKMITEPLVDAGIRLVHHCDGNITPLVKDIIDAGFSGLQGFQFECGVDPYELRNLRSKLGEEMLLFSGMNVTRTLPFGTIDDVKEEVDYLMNATDGGRGLFLLSSNVIGKEVPIQNIETAYRYAKEWNTASPRNVKRFKWPWLINHPDTDERF